MTSRCRSRSGSARPSSTAAAETKRRASRGEKYGRTLPSAAVGTTTGPTPIDPTVAPDRISCSAGTPAVTRSISTANAGMSVPSIAATSGTARITPPSGSADTSPQPAAARFRTSTLDSAPAKRITRSEAGSSAEPAGPADRTTIGGARTLDPVASGIPATASTTGLPAIARARIASLPGSAASAAARASPALSRRESSRSGDSGSGSGIRMSTPIAAGPSLPMRSTRSARSDRGHGQRPKPARLGPSISTTVAGSAETARGNRRWQRSNHASDNGDVNRGRSAIASASAVASAAPAHRMRSRRGAGAAAATPGVKGGFPARRTQRKP
jgi:hypothetical protein